MIIIVLSEGEINKKETFATLVGLQIKVKATLRDCSGNIMATITVIIYLLSLGAIYFSPRRGFYGDESLNADTKRKKDFTQFLKTQL